MKLSNISSVVILLLLSQLHLCQYFCKTDTSIKNAITAIEREYVGKGSFGTIYGNDSHVSKTMKTDDSVSMYLLNNELKIMIAYNTEVDFTQLKEDNCWYKYNNRLYHYEVKVKMDRMASDMKAALKSSQLKSRTIWKIDMMFKILIGIKKLHDNNILHLDLKEQNIMMMNEYTPVIADFGMALLDGESRNWQGGTPLFMAPEVKFAKYTKGTDMFALGIIFFQLLNERFVNNQSFRKLCNRSESTYTNAYCLFDQIISRMLSSSSSQRPSVDTVIEEVLKVVKMYVEENPARFNEYMEQERSLINSPNAKPATKLHREKLLQKLELRKEIYEAAAEGKDRQTLKELIKEYAKPVKDIKKFFRENSSRTGIVGKNKQEIKDQNEMVDDEEDQLQSIRNIQKRMKDAHDNRAEFLKNERFFRDEDIQDRIVDVPNVQLKRLPSNNVVRVEPQEQRIQINRDDFKLKNGQKKAPSNNFRMNGNRKVIPSNNFNALPKRAQVPSNNFNALPKRGQVPSNNFINANKKAVKPSNNFDQHKKNIVPSNNIQVVRKPGRPSNNFQMRKQVIPQNDIILVRNPHHVHQEQQIQQPDQIQPKLFAKQEGQQKFKMETDFNVFNIDTRNPYINRNVEPQDRVQVQEQQPQFDYEQHLQKAMQNIEKSLDKDNNDKFQRDRLKNLQKF